LHTVKQKGTSVLLELRNAAEKMYVKLDEWLGMKYRSEVANIEKMIEFIKASVEVRRNLFLSYIYNFEGGSTTSKVTTAEFRPCDYR
jgi:hypothetical protein